MPCQVEMHRANFVKKYEHTLARKLFHKSYSELKADQRNKIDKLLEKHGVELYRNCVNMAKYQKCRWRRSKRILYSYLGERLRNRQCRRMKKVQNTEAIRKRAVRDSTETMDDEARLNRFSSDAITICNANSSLSDYSRFNYLSTISVESSMSMESYLAPSSNEHFDVVNMVQEGFEEILTSTTSSE